MAAKARRQKPASRALPASGSRQPVGQPAPTAGDLRARIGIAVAVILVAVVAVIGADVVFGAISGGGGTPTASPTATATPAAQSVSAAAPSSFGVVVPANGGSWINVTPDELAQMLQHKDFTLLNVKTPYSGEIEGTDLYIPYTQIAARASELPTDRGAKILVYCRTGATSAIADQTLIDLGYTNIWNLDGGMAAWQASGRQLVNKNR